MKWADKKDVLLRVLFNVDRKGRTSNKDLIVSYQELADAMDVSFSDLHSLKRELLKDNYVNRTLPYLSITSEGKRYIAENSDRIERLWQKYKNDQLENLGRQQARSEKIRPSKRWFPNGLWKSRTLHLLVCEIVVLVALFLSVRWFAGYLKSINQLIVGSIAPEVEISRVPAGDPVSGLLFDYLDTRDFVLSDGHSSSVVQALSKQEFAAADLLAHNDYSSLFHLLKHLYLLGRFTDEKETIDIWIRWLISDVGFSRKDVPNLLAYIENMYVSVIGEYIMNFQFGQANWLSERAGERVRMMDLQPLDLVDPYTNERCNKILILEALFSRPGRCLARPKDVFFLLEIVSSGFHERYRRELSLHLLESESLLLPPINYFEGIYAFGNENYGKAAKQFESVLEAKYSARFDELSKLMLARCVFWAHEKELLAGQPLEVFDTAITDTEGSIAVLQDILTVITEPTYRNDVSAYAMYLTRRTQTEDKPVEGEMIE